MITKIDYPNKSEITIFHDCEKSIAIDVVMKVGLNLKPGEVLAVLVQTQNPVGILMHVRTFDTKVNLDEMKKCLREDMQSKETVFSGADYIVKECGTHPRVFLNKLLDEN